MDEISIVIIITYFDRVWALYTNSHKNCLTVVCETDPGTQHLLRVEEKSLVVFKLK